LDGILI